MSSMLKPVLAAIVLAAASLGSAATASADDSACFDVWGEDSGIHMRRVTYLGPFSSSADDLRADFGDSSHTVRLRGWLYFTEDKLIKNARVLIYNHGHNQVREEPCAIAKYFVKKGWVVFAPLRRGHSGDEGSQIRSTGVHIDEYVTYCQAAACGDPRCAIPVCSGDALEVSYTGTQREDVRDQIDYILSHAAIARDGSAAAGKLANPRQVAIAGHSYGGSVIVFANSQTTRHNVAISISGAELSWNGNPFWEVYLTSQMPFQKRPIYFLQPKNGCSLEPTKTLFSMAVGHYYRSQAAIFPPAPWDPDKDDSECRQAHGTFITARDQVELWGPSVINFITRHPLQ